MGKIVFDVPPDVRAALEKTDPDRLKAIQEATEDFREALGEATQEVLATESGQDTLSKAVGQSADGNVYVFVDPTIKGSSAAFQSPDGNKGIIIQPCEGNGYYLGTDGQQHQYGLSRIIAHEGAHIANGDQNDRLFKRSESKIERKAIDRANEIAKEADPNNPQRDPKSHGHSGGTKTITSEEQCSPKVLEPGF